jgi:hypothetical protein
VKKATFSSIFAQANALRGVTPLLRAVSCVCVMGVDVW